MALKRKSTKIVPASKADIQEIVPALPRYFRSTGQRTVGRSRGYRDKGLLRRLHPESVDSPSWSHAAGMRGRHLFKHCWSHQGEDDEVTELPGGEQEAQSAARDAAVSRA
jgi:hypothetical protein